MKTNIKLLTVLLATFIVGGCQDYDQLVRNPNLPTTAPPSLIFSGILNTMNDDNAWNNGSTTGAQTFNQFWLSSYTYYGSNNYDQNPFIGGNFDYYFTLQNVVQMELEAKKLGAPDRNPYSALGKFFRAYYYNLLSQKMGDLPQSEALAGRDKIAPVYDSQHDVYVQILKLLDEANSDLAAMISAPGAISLPLAGDMYLNNDLQQWQKIVNAFTLRVLISLSQKESDGTLNLKQKFAAIVNDPAKYPLMTGLEDNLQYIYNSQFNIYPKNPGVLGFTKHRENMSSTFLNLTTSLNDPRTFITSTPAPAQLATHTFDQQAAYVGADPGEDMSTLGTNAQNGTYSYVNCLRYYTTYDGSKAEPAIIIGYPEMCFNIAEGINRGWATGSASTWYTNGITGAMKHLGLVDGSKIDVADIDLVIYGTVTVSITNYLAQASVVYAGNNAAGLNQILTQKYLAFWQNSNWEAFFNQRRTGVPTFQTGSGTGNGQLIPKRWQYPYGELTANEANYKSAVQRQFGGEDNLNGTLWINQ